MKALGMIEVYGYTTAVEALDSALKAANVNLLDVTIVRGGLVTVLITGDVGAVKASIDASSSAAERIGTVVSVHVIPRPSKEIVKIISYHDSEKKPEVSQDKEPEIDKCNEKSQVAGVEVRMITVEMLKSMRVDKLRRLAREIRIPNMTRKQISFATKDELIRSISESIEQER